jgi:predicted secreted protein
MPSDTINVTIDEEFTISLQTIATAGYLWKIESVPKSVDFLGTENEKTAGDRKPGDSINQIFRFRAREPGDHEIKFALGRPWENEAIEAKAVTVKVNQ